MINLMDKWLKLTAIKIIKFYQATFSPDHSPFRHAGIMACRFHPSCSQYAIDCYQKYSFIKASFKIIWRLLRCQPFNPGGYDPA